MWDAGQEKDPVKHRTRTQHTQGRQLSRPRLIESTTEVQGPMHPIARMPRIFCANEPAARLERSARFAQQLRLRARGRLGRRFRLP